MRGTVIGICLAEAVACRGEPDSLEQRVQEPQDAALRRARVGYGEPRGTRRGAREAQRGCSRCAPPTTEGIAEGVCRGRGGPTVAVTVKESSVKPGTFIVESARRRGPSTGMCRL